MTKHRLDLTLVQRGLVKTRSQAESYIKLGNVKVDGQTVSKPGFFVGETTRIELTAKKQYVSRAALKLASVTTPLQLDFQGKIVLDVGSSTGGFTDYALQHCAKKIIAVEVGHDQLHPTLLNNPQIELHEGTDIRNFADLLNKNDDRRQKWSIDLVLIDVSFVSLREILPSVAKLAPAPTQIIAMVKPQFEAGQSSLKHKGVIKNDAMRRQILKDFENWAKKYFVILDKADSEVKGAKGNQERFYVLQTLKK